MSEPNNDHGTFDEMVTLASERALAEGGVVVIHRMECEDVDNCLCQPKVIQPYEPVDESIVSEQ